MRELVPGYKQAIKLLDNRISELVRLRDFLQARTRDPEQLGMIEELNERLKPLRSMLNDLREVTREVEHYYDRSWWRSEELTCNQRKSRRFIYAGPSRR